MLGAGNMGAAILRGALSAGLFRPDEVVIVEPEDHRRAAAASLGVRPADSPAAALHALTPGGLLVLAVKPQVYPAVAAVLRDAGRNRGPQDARAVVSIMAGVTTARLAADLAPARIVRVMPNLGVTVGQGAIALCPGPGATEQDLARVRSLFEALGVVYGLPESLMDAFTALAGSGPAYVCLLAEGMIQGAVDAGIPLDQARAIAAQTVRASAALLSTPEPGPGGAEPAAPTPETLRARVTSPNGTTAAALAVLEERGVRHAVADAVLAARDRGRTLGSS